DYYEERRYKHRKGWARDGYGMPPGHAKRYLIGERMPVTYVRQREYVIVEPARYRLRPAPVGYRWVRYDRDAYLVAAETGLIAQAVRAVLDYLPPCPNGPDERLGSAPPNSATGRSGPLSSPN